MVVYADILILVNFIVDYFLIKLTACITKSYIKIFRMVIAAFIGSIFSLYIFLPPLNPFLEILLKLVTSAVMVCIGFGFCN